MTLNDQLYVRSFENNKIIVEIINIDEWKANNTGQDIKIGSFLKIEDGNEKAIITLIQSFKMVENINLNDGSESRISKNFILDTYPIGQLETIEDTVKFQRGVKDISIPPSSVSPLTTDELQLIYSDNSQPFIFSSHESNNKIDIVVDGDKFFSKHLAVVGSTGSGKSCTVAKILQEASKSNEDILHNTHIIIFDIHGEYQNAFSNKSRYISIDNSTLHLPYWLMNSEELEDFFIESNEQNSHNQLSQFKHAIINNKIRHNPGLEISYDSPVYFSLDEVINYLNNKNNETKYSKDNSEYYALKDGTELGFSEHLIHDKFWGKLEFYQPSGTSNNAHLKAKVSRGSFYGEFNRFISRFETKRLDKRLSFMLDSEYKDTENFYEIIQNIIGYHIEKERYANISIIDLSSLPFEIISIVVSIITRFTFEFCYYKTKNEEKNDTPYLLVYEEAHKYIPKLNETKYRNTRIAVERVAKEGRKYGLSCMIVSQRPSEISPTVFSQCTNFVVMRLTNPDDQIYVKRLLPDNFEAYTNSLSMLDTKQALLIGDSIKTPCLVTIKDASPLPKSENVLFLEEWKKSWVDIDFDSLFSRLIRKNSN